MLHWVCALYSCPTAQIRVNGILSSHIKISNGTRQGCPISPLLTLEPFLCTIRNNQNIKGIPFPSIPEQKVAAYADDLLFFVSSPTTSFLT